MMFLGALLEVISISFFIPIITTMINEDFFSNYPKIYFLYDFFGNPSKDEQLYIFLFSFLAIFLFKNLYLLFYLWKESKFISYLKEDISRKLYRKYINKDYKFHVKTNSSTITSRLTADLNLFATAAQSVIIIISEILVTGFLGIFLFILEPRGLIFAVIFFSFISILLNLTTSQKIKKIGKLRFNADSNKIKKIQEVFSGIKDIKVFRVESNFINKYNEISKSLFKIYTWFRFLQRTPRIYFEIVLVFSLTFLILLLYFFGENLSSILKTIGIFAVASIRILPSINKLFSAYQLINFSKLPINLITNIVTVKEKNNFLEKTTYVPDIENFKNIVFDNVTFDHRKDKEVFKNFNFQIKAGEKIAIIGKTGSGKTTFLDLLVGLNKIRSGKILINGKEVNFFKPYPLKVGYVPQKVQLFDKSIKKNIIFEEENKIDKKKYLQIIKISQLESFIKKLPKKDNTLVGENALKISGGQAQRIGIARALYQNPDLIVFDEPTSALDTKTEKDLIEKIFHSLKQKTVIMVTHEVNNLRYFKKVFLLKNKKLTKVR